jgi:hypothetical protein
MNGNFRDRGDEGRICQLQSCDINLYCSAQVKWAGHWRGSRARQPPTSLASRARLLTSWEPRRTRFEKPAGRTLGDSESLAVLPAEVIPKALLADSYGDSRIAAGLIQVGAEDRAMASAVGLREDYSAAALRALARRSKTSTRAGGSCRWLRSGTGWTGARRRRSAGWTARRCVTGSIASTPPGPGGLSSRAPELNLVENVWQYLRQNWLSNTVFENYDAIVDAACAAW